MDFDALQTAILDDVSVSSTDTFYSTALVKRVVNRAIKWVAAYKNWPHTEQAYTRSAIASQEYYDYPVTPTVFRSDTIRKLRYNGINYTKVNFRDYLKYQEDNGANATDKLFSDHRKQYFINPAPTSTATIEIWGQEVPADLVSGSDKSPFYTETNIEEAIIKKALSILYKKGRGTMYDRGVELEEQAKLDLADEWSKIKKNEADYKPKDSRIFNSIDILPNNRAGRRTKRGTFAVYNN